MPAWYRNNLGAVLSFSIDKYCYLLCRELPPYFNYRFRLAYSRVETVSEIDEILHPAIREGIRFLAPNMNLEINHHSDLPARSGIGSSSAFAVGLINALNLLNGNQMDKVSLADAAIDLEQNKIGECVGSQDQIACALGGLNLLEFGGSREWKANPVVMNNEKILQLEDRMYLVFSGISRTSSDIAVGLVSDIESKEKELRRLREIVYEAKEILDQDKDLDILGELLNESWHLKKQTNSKASVNEIDKIIFNGIKCGALGAKVLGAGGGGFILFWLREGDKSRFSSTFKEGTHVPIKIDMVGATTLESSF
jgi:D-glycero-alpha-D-manno-heptose-7-phosphate kinase